MPIVGFHILAELYGCNAQLLEKLEPVKTAMEKAVEAGGLTKLDSKFHQFEPHGVTGIVLLSESHISVHTWPEHNYLAVDLFTCGPPDKARAAYNSLVDSFKPERTQMTEKVRGEQE